MEQGVELLGSGCWRAEIIIRQGEPGYQIFYRLLSLNREIFIDPLKHDYEVSLQLLKNLIERIQRVHQRDQSQLLESETFRIAIPKVIENVMVKDGAAINGGEIDNC